MTHTSHNKLVSFIWSIADDCLRDVYVRGKYRDIILPFVVLRRIDSLLETTKAAVLEELRYQQENISTVELEASSLQAASGYVFYNTSSWTMEKLKGTVTNSQQKLVANFEEYLSGFSANVKEIIEKFKIYLREKYNTANGQFVLYSCFIENGILNLSKNGVLTFITSNTFLSNKDFKSLRKFILSKTRILSLVNLDENVFDTAQVDVAVFSLSKDFVVNNQIKIFANRSDFQKNDFDLMNQSYFYDEYKNFEINANLRTKEIALFDKIEQCTHTINDYLDLPRGIEIGGNSDLISNDNSFGKVPLLVGKNIAQNSIKFNDQYIYYNDKDKSIYKERGLFEQHKILIQRIRNLTLKQRIVATLDKDNFYCTNTLRIGILKDKEDSNDYTLKFVLAILNSNVVNFCFSKLFLNKDIYSYQLQRIPVPIWQKESNLFIIIDCILFKHSTLLVSVIDSAICNLYFTDHMQDLQIDVISYIESDIEEVLQKRDFEVMTDKEKEDVIEKLHKKWTDPNNEVVKRMGQFKEKSPDILKVIIEC